ncbi:unnamed protein product [Meloidogyne enterolobii]|uniref:Uncharacterized protein n=1 Tax=Meloidogyne enterolobii TaxID=390850 RepID=A0ACB0YXQ7_MELEN
MVVNYLTLYFNFFLKFLGCNKHVVIFVENAFKKLDYCLNYSLYYFEVKCKFKGELDKGITWMDIGLKNCSTNEYVAFDAEEVTIYTEKDQQFRFSTHSWNNNDIFGCGLVYPPTNMMNEFPYVFFTKNGKQIGKGTLLKQKCDSYKPYVDMSCFSIEGNFGNNLATKPFKYDILKHLILKEFY